MYNVTKGQIESVLKLRLGRVSLVADACSSRMYRVSHYNFLLGKQKVVIADGNFTICLFSYSLYRQFFM